MVLNGATIDIWGQIILSCGNYFVHCRMVSSIPGLYASRKTLFPPVMIAKNISRHHQMCLGDESPRVENRTKRASLHVSSSGAVPHFSICSQALSPCPSPEARPPLILWGLPALTHSEAFLLKLPLLSFALYSSLSPSDHSDWPANTTP